jgi:neutral ceramidase
VSRVSITPDTVAERVPLGGYTARGAKRAVGVHDDVYARALVLDDGKTRLALVSCEMLTVPASLKTAVLTRLPEWTSDRLLLAATHTHSAPDSQRLNVRMRFPVPGIATYDAKALDWTAERIARAVREAEAHLEPVSVSVGIAEAGLSRLRRWASPPPAEDVPIPAPPWLRRPWSADLSVPAPSGGPRTAKRVSDALRLADIRRADGSVLAVLVNYAAHPTIYDEKNLKISGDWPGTLAREWERVHPGAELLFFNGAMGDRSPVADDPVGAEKRVELYAQRILRVVDAAEASARPTSGPLEMAVATVPLPTPIPHPELEADLKKQGIPKALLMAAINGFVAREEPCTIYRIGSWWFLGVPGEPTTEVGERLRRIAGGKAAFVVSFSNDWAGYILTPGQYEMGGYEATVSFNGPGLCDAILRGFRSAVRQLR